MFEYRLDDTHSLRPADLADAEALAHAVAANREHLLPWLPDHVLATPQAWLAERAAEMARGAGFAATVWRGGELAGVIWTSKLDVAHRKAQVHFWLVRDACGRGIMTRSLAAVLEHLFAQRGLHRATVRAPAGHPRVRPLLERLGFVHEGVIRESVWRDGTPCDDDLFGLLAREFRRPLP